MAAAGEIGMSEREFYATSPGYFAALWKGYERRIQHEYEVARYIGFHAIQPLKASVKSWRINKYSDLGRFPWETWINSHNNTPNVCKKSKTCQ